MSSFSEVVQWLEEHQEIQGVNVSDILELPEPLRQTMQKMLYGQSMSLGQFADEMSFSISDADLLSQVLVKKGYLIVVGEEGKDKTTYRVRLAKIRGRQIDIDL